MLAIAGAKGGCGKSTTALGLAGAFARAGTRAVAVDADLQLPTLHVIADVDRTPTLADLDDRDAGAVVHDLSDSPDAGVVPAPEGSTSIDLDAALGRLSSAVPRVLVDCPSGAGPDAVEPMQAADRVVVVTTGTERSVSAARTTIDVAERLGVPVAGAILTRRESVPDAVADRLDVPLLGAIPDRDAPLTATATREAYDDALDALSTEPGTQSRAQHGDAVDTARLPTGLQALDGALDGGIPRGYVVAVTAAPASPAERLLHGLTATRGTLYLSTDRTPALVERALEASSVPTRRPTIRPVPRDVPLAEAERLVRDLPDGANLIVDAVNRLERADRAAYVDFLDALKERMAETGGLAVLHCVEGDSVPAGRSITERAADAVFDVRATGGGPSPGTRLTIPKFRGDAPARSIDLTAENPAAHR